MCPLQQQVNNVYLNFWCELQLEGSLCRGGYSVNTQCNPAIMPLLSTNPWAAWVYPHIGYNFSALIVVFNVSGMGGRKCDCCVSLGRNQTCAKLSRFSAEQTSKTPCLVMFYFFINMHFRVKKRNQVFSVVSLATDNWVRKWERSWAVRSQ